MGIVQTNTFTCEVCGKVETKSEEVGMYSDPVVVPPDGWAHRESDDKLACPECVKK
jgi:hypothetical protein